MGGASQGGSAVPGGRVLRAMHVAQPTDAGVANVVLALINDQKARGWDVHLACPTSVGYLAERARAAGVSVHRWESSRSPHRGILPESRRLASVIASVRPDVVHLHSAKAGLIGRLVVRGKTATIFQPHAWSFEAVSGVVERATVLWERWAARWTTATLCVSEAEAGRGRGLGCLAPVVTVIPNGVDIAAWGPNSDEEARLARSTLDVPHDAFMAVVVGRLARQKGQDIALRAWPAVTAQVPGARLYLVGDGPEADNLANSCPAGAELRPAGPPGDWYRAADVVRVPSRWEGMALVVLEAMASGAALLCSDVPGSAEALDDPEQIVPNGDEAALARGVVEYAGDRSRVLAKRLRNADRARTAFSIKGSCERVAEFTAEVAARSSGRRHG